MHFNVVSATNSATNRDVFAIIEGSSENQGLLSLVVSCIPGSLNSNDCPGCKAARGLRGC